MTNTRKIIEAIKFCRKSKSCGDCIAHKEAFCNILPPKIESQDILVKMLEKDLQVWSENT